MNKFTFFLALFFCVGIWGCEDKEKEVVPKPEIIYPSAEIVKQLPIMYASIYEDGRILVVNSKEQLQELFKDKKLPKALKYVELENNTLILNEFGKLGEGLKIKDFTQSFVKNEDEKNQYEYELQTRFDFEEELENKVYLFGILVKKLPETSVITLKIKETAPAKIFQQAAEFDCPPTPITRGKYRDILGTWKLTKRVIIDDVCGTIADVSCDNALFHFNENGTFKVEGNTNFWESKNYTYSYTPNKNATSYELKIDDKKTFECWVDQYEMKITYSDSKSEETYSFIRTN